jgi:hypothetical protein
MYRQIIVRSPSFGIGMEWNGMEWNGMELEWNRIRVRYTIYSIP